MNELALMSRDQPQRRRDARAGPAPQQRYMAFLSYSHRDSDMADWLHEALERFRGARSGWSAS